MNKIKYNIFIRDFDEVYRRIQPVTGYLFNNDIELAIRKNDSGFWVVDDLPSGLGLGDYVKGKTRKECEIKLNDFLNKSCICGGLCYSNRLEYARSRPHYKELCKQFKRLEAEKDVK